MEKLKSIISSSPIATKTFFLGWLVLVAVFIFFKGGLEAWNNRSGDFNNYYVSSVLASEGEAIYQFYDNAWFREKALEIGVEEGAKFAPFPPITTFLYYPLARTDFMTAKRTWLVFNCFLLCFLPFRIQRIFGIPLPVGILIMSLFFVPISSNFNFGQAYLLVTFFIIEAIGLAKLESKKNLAAIILAFCALVKYLPILFIFYLFDPLKNKLGGIKTILYKQKFLIFFFGTIAVFIGISYFTWPKAYTAYFSTFSNHLQGDLSGQGKFAIGFQSLDSLLNNLFVAQGAALIQIPILKPILKTVFFVGIGLVCFRVFKKDHYRFNTINSSIIIFGAFSLLPASASYHFLFLLTPAILIFKWLLELESKRPAIIFTVLLLMTFCIQAHHMPNIQFSKTLYCLVLYPRFWCLLLLFAYLSYLKLKDFENYLSAKVDT